MTPRLTGASHTRSADSRNRRGALLLEVVVAMAIMVAALGLLGAQLVGGLRMTGYGEQQTRAAELADRLLALLELDQETAKRVFVDRQTDGDFGSQYPGYLWRAFVEPTSVQGLGRLTIEIRYQPPEQRNGNVDEAALVRQLHMLKADPGRIDLAKDFGVDEEKLASFVTQVPIPGFDPTQLDPQAIAGLDPAMLMQVLPALLELLQQNGGGGFDLAQLPKTPDELQSFMEEQLQANRDRLEQAAGGALGQGGGPGGGGSGGQGSDDNVKDDAPDGGLGGGQPGGAGGRPGGGRQGGGATIEDLLRLRDQGGASPGAASGQPGSRGQQPPVPRGGRGGSGSGDVKPGGGDVKPGSGGGARTPVGNGGRQGGSGGRQGGGSGAAGSGAGNRPAGGYTIEDLMRLRDEMNRQQGGG